MLLLRTPNWAGQLMVGVCGRNCKSSFLWAAGKSMHYLEEWRQFLEISLVKFEISANYVGVFFADGDYLSAMK